MVNGSLSFELSYYFTFSNIGNYSPLTIADSRLPIHDFGATMAMK
jgi:hypothetical protein